MQHALLWLGKRSGETDALHLPLQAANVIVFDTQNPEQI